MSDNQYNTNMGQYDKNEGSEPHTYISSHLTKTQRLVLFISAFVVLVAGYVWASNKEAEARKERTTTTVGSEETLDYESDYVIVGNTMYVKPSEYEGFPISGMNVKAYKFDENGDLVEDNQPLVEVVRADDLSGYTYNATADEYQKTFIGPDGKPTTDCIKPEGTARVKK